MKRHHHPAFVSDICLLLRAHGEQRWLGREVIPVLRDLEVPDCIPSEQLGAALAYLEVHWLEARRRAAQTERAYDQLQARERTAHGTLAGMACHYHAVVRDVRTEVAAHVAEHLRAAAELAEHPPADGEDPAPGHGPRTDPVRFRTWRRPSIFNPTQRTPTGRSRPQL